MQTDTPPANPPVDGWFTGWRLLLAVGAALFVLFPEVFLGTHTFFYRDFGCFSYPVAKYHRECFWRGEWPLWNPYNNCGIPFLAQWNTVTLYPGTLIYLLLPLPMSVGWFNLAHLFLAGWGMHRLARRWTGNAFAASAAGLVFAVNGLTLHCLMWTSNLPALCWMPVVVDEIERATRSGGRRLLLAMLVAGMQLLTGAPEIILLTWLLAGSLVLGQAWWEGRGKNWRVMLQPFRRITGIGLGMLGLGAAQLLPFLQLLSQSSRGAGTENNAWALPGWGVVNFLVPLFHTSPSIVGVYTQNEQQWTSSYYVGIGTVALALLAPGRRRPRVWWLWSMAVAGVLLALGSSGVLLPLLGDLLPPLALIRYPVKLIALTVFALPLLAAFGLQAWLDQPSAHRQNWRRRAGGVVVLLLAGIGWAVWQARISPARDELAADTARNGWQRAAFLLALGALLFAACRTKGWRPARWLRAGFLLLLGADVLLHMPKQNPTVVNAAYAPQQAYFNLGVSRPLQRMMITPPVHQFMDQAAHRHPLLYCLGNRRVMFGDWNLVDGLPKINGFYSQYLRPYREVEQVWQNWGHRPEHLLDFLGVSLATSDDLLFAWTARSNALPLVTAGQQPVYADERRTLAVLATPLFRPEAEVYLPPEWQSRLPGLAQGAATVSKVEQGTHTLKFEVNASRPALAVLAVSRYPAWQAWVNGVPAPVIPANHAFMAVSVPAGKATVELRYVDRVFQTGLLISGATALLLCGLAWRWRRCAAA